MVKTQKVRYFMYKEQNFQLRNQLVNKEFLLGENKNGVEQLTYETNSTALRDRLVVAQLPKKLATFYVNGSPQTRLQVSATVPYLEKLACNGARGGVIHQGIALQAKRS
jgi:hypothetical protein